MHHVAMYATLTSAMSDWRVSLSQSSWVYVRGHKVVSLWLEWNCVTHWLVTTICALQYSSSVHSTPLNTALSFKFPHPRGLCGLSTSIHSFFPTFLNSEWTAEQRRSLTPSPRWATHCLQTNLQHVASICKKACFTLFGAGFLHRHSYANVSLGSSELVFPLAITSGGDVAKLAPLLPDLLHFLAPRNEPADFFGQTSLHTNELVT